MLSQDVDALKKLVLHNAVSATLLAFPLSYSISLALVDCTITAKNITACLFLRADLAVMILLMTGNIVF